jgi:hypothetical protein
MTKLQEYAASHPREYAAKAAEANEQGKTLELKEGELVFKDIELSLEEIKEAKKQEINAKKQAEEYANISYLNTQFQADADSQFKISAAITALSAARLKSYDWFDADNKKITLSKSELIDLGILISIRSSNLVAKARELKDKLKKARSKAAVEAIVWESNQ